MGIWNFRADCATVCCSRKQARYYVRRNKRLLRERFDNNVFRWGKASKASQFGLSHQEHEKSEYNRLKQCEQNRLLMTRHLYLFSVARQKRLVVEFEANENESVGNIYVRSRRGKWNLEKVATCLVNLMEYCSDGKGISRNLQFWWLLNWGWFMHARESIVDSHFKKMNNLN